jgi:hypothetical protein
MTSDHALPPQLRPLLDALCDGTVSSSDLQELESLALAAEPAREQLLKYLELDAALRWEFGAGMETRLPAAMAIPQHATGRANAPVSTTGTSKARDTQPIAKPLWTNIPLMVLNRPALASIAVVALVFYGSFLAISWNLWGLRGPRTEIGSSVQDRGAVAKIVAENATVWSPQIPREAASRLSRGQRLSLASGAVEIELTRGAKLIVEGPADWSIDGENRVSLRAGSLIARVPAHAVGFTIETPTAEIIDLGTEFGVDVDATGRTDVQVLEGTVNVHYSSLAGESKSARRSVRMSAGSAKRFSVPTEKAGNITATEIAPWLDKTASIFKHSGQRETLSAETRYAAAVLADRPLGYWRFSDTDGHRAVDASGHGNHGEYFGVVSTKNPGICAGTSDRSIRFLGKQYGGYVQITDFKLPASCTVELWAKSTTPRWNSYGWLLSSRAPEGLQITPVEAGRNWQAYVGNADVYFAEIGPHQGPARIDDRFHQYAFSYDAVDDRGALYCDGVLVHEATKMFGDKPRHKATHLTMYVGRLAPEYYESWAEASVDELAIYDGALPAAAIQRHFEAAGVSMKNDIEHPPSPVPKE